MRLRAGWRRAAAGLLTGLILAGPAAASDDGLADLPLQVMAARPPGDTLVLLLSGDTGWNGLEPSLARRFARAGLGVIGLDSRRYFFNGRSPAELARDLDRIVAFYRRRWRIRHLVLAGYSFGADALPFAWPRLSAGTRRATRLIALVGLLPQANFRISVWEMLNLPAPDDTPVAPMLRGLPARKVICLHGREEESACTLPELAGAERVVRPGGHDRDGDAAAVAQALMARLSAPRGHRR